MTTPHPRQSDGGFTEIVLAIFTGEAEKTSQEASIGKSGKPIDLIRSLTGKLGKEWVLWEPETLWAAVKDAFGVAPPDLLKNKIQAAKSLLTSNGFWADHLAFEKVTMAFNNHVPLFDQYQNPSPAMMANAIEEAGKIRKAEFSDEVLRFIAVAAYQDGLMLLPEPLDVAQEHLDELTAGSVGRQFKEDIQRRWSDSKVAPDGVYQETPTGVHLAKMAAIQEYVRTF